MNKHSILKKSFSCIMAVALMLNSATYAGEFDLFEPAESFEEVAAEEFDILGEESVAEILPEFDVIEEPVVEEEPILLDSIAEEDIFDFGDESVVEPTEDIIFLDEAPAFEKGYVSVKAETDIYEKESTEKKIGSFVEDAVVYAVASDIVTVENDKWLKITFDTADAKEKEEDLMTGYVLDKDVTVLTDEEVKELVDGLILDETTRDFEDNLLPVVKFAPAVEETEDAVIEVFGLDEEEFDTDLQEEEFDVVEVMADDEEVVEESEEELFDVIEIFPVAEEAEVEAAEEETEAEDAFDGEEVVVVEELDDTTEETVLEEAEIEESEDIVLEEAVEDEVEAAADGAPVITVQPVTQTVALSSKVTFTVEATNADSYQWQIDRGDGRGFVDLASNAQWLNTTTANFSFVARLDREPYSFRVVAKNANGEAISNVVKQIIGTKPTIVTQPTDQTVPLNKIVNFVVEATNADSYQWQVDRGDDRGFVNLSSNAQWMNTTTAHFSFMSRKDREPYTFRVVVSNKFGQTISDEVKQYIGSVPYITVQPETQTVALNKKVTFTVEATNAESYQWQIDRADGKGFVNLATNAQWLNTTTPSFSFTSRKDREPYSFRVVVKNAAGEAISNVVKQIIAVKPVITSQPTDQTVALNTKVTFTVEATNAESYQWQIDRADGKGFVNLASNAQWLNTTTPTFSFTSRKDREPYSFRVVVKNSAGEEISNVVKQIIASAPTIKVQPQDQTVALSEKVHFTVEAENADSYQWQIDRADGKGFVNLASNAQWLNTTTADFSFTSRKDREPYSFRVVVKNAFGEVKSNVVKQYIGTKPVITVQPTTQTVALNKTVTFKVEATNADSYQWQIDRADGKGFVNLASNAQWLNTTTDTFSFTSRKDREPYTFRCVVKNSVGEVISDEVKQIIASKPVITVQPVSQNVEVGDTVTFTVEATNAETYQWQIDRGDDKGFVNLSETLQWKGTKTNTFTFTARKDREPYSFRVVVKNSVGEEISDVVKQTIVQSTFDGVKYSILTDTTVTIESYSGTAATLVIPETVTIGDVTYTVTEVGEDAFANNQTLTSIDLPNSITVIRARAFKNCTNLSEMKNH